jgi:hypothetical protein
MTPAQISDNAPNKHPGESNSIPSGNLLSWVMFLTSSMMESYLQSNHCRFLR